MKRRCGKSCRPTLVLSGRKIDIVRLALPGQKQPQQLMTLAWVQSLGAEFDIVVNLDGYNEAVL